VVLGFKLKHERGRGKIDFSGEAVYNGNKNNDQKRKFFTGTQ